MRITLYILSLCIFIFSCSKNAEKATYPDENYVEVKYDTTPVDSFSAGATSIDVAKKIRMSSLAYQDSVKQALLKQEEEKKLKEQEDKLKKEAEKSLEKEKPKTETPKQEQNNVEAPKPDPNTAPTSNAK